MKPHQDTPVLNISGISELGKVSLVGAGGALYFCKSQIYMLVLPFLW